MAWFSKKATKRPPSTEDANLTRRIQALRDGELLDQAEPMLYDIGRAMSEYRKSGDLMWIGYAQEATLILGACLNEMADRAAASRPGRRVSPG